MSYGDQVTPLEFTGLRLACLSGDNGNGKSALLDAITWALWGEARAPSDELIRLGADEMRVVFDFRLGNDVYRVIRGRNRRTSSHMWELYIAENADETIHQRGGIADSPDHSSLSMHKLMWRSLTGQGIRDTARIIQRILRMDYKTFINSAYIQQGRADEFAKQTVADRKKILADILDLSRYDILEQKAKDRRNETESRAHELEREIVHIEQELANEELWKAEVSAAQSEHERLASDIRRVEARLHDLQVQKAKLEETEKRIEEVNQQIVSSQKEIESLNEQFVEQEKRVHAHREILQQRNEIQAGLTKLRSVQEQVTRLDNSLRELHQLERSKAEIERQLIAQKHELDLERSSLSKELAELQSKIDEAARIERDAVKLREQVAELNKLDARLTDLRQVMTAESKRWSSLKAQHDALFKIRGELEEKLRLLAKPGAKCPICHTDLGETKHQEIVNDYQRQIADVDLQLQETLAGVSDAEKKQDAAQAELEKIESQLRDGSEVHKRLAQADQVLFQAEKYREHLPDVQSRLNALTEKLRTEDYAHEARAQLADVASRIAALGYDSDTHHALKEQLESLKDYESRAIALSYAEQNLPVDETNLNNIKSLIIARQKSISEYQASLQVLQSAITELPSVRTELEEVSHHLQTLRQTDQELIGRISTLQRDLNRCEELRNEVAEKRKALEQVRRDRIIYNELALAFGKKGVQALIIENAIPEIQEEANRLLGRMTDNAMKVSFETVRDKKTGGTAETLDIRVSDDMGTRSYELYSGGEAFRINFALRIALSKLLARRAGARLQTLIIDEGFGTQDGKGREKLVDAINSIKDDFELILVITHIDELRDAFPTRIEITKDSQGSQISVN